MPWRCLNTQIKCIFDFEHQAFLFAPLVSFTLFLLIMEGICTIITKARENDTLKGFHFGGFVHITHLLFVDDILLLFDGSRKEINKLKALLALFSEAIRTICNPRKSVCIFCEYGHYGHNLGY